MAAKSAAEILEAALKRMKKQNSAYSLRALARDLKISPSFLSGIMSGKRAFPRKRIGDFAKALRMDESAKKILTTAVDREFLKKSDITVEEKSAGESSLGRFKELPPKSQSLLQHWYFVAILDLVICEKGSLTPEKIAKRLGLKATQARQALHFLTSQGWLEEKNGILRKSDGHIRFPTAESREQVRRFHRQMIQLAAQELVQNTDEDSFQSRLINGITFAANPEHLEKARVRLNEALYEVAEILMEGECTEVYQLNSQLFKLTR